MGDEVDGVLDLGETRYVGGRVVGGFPYEFAFDALVFVAVVDDSVVDDIAGVVASAEDVAVAAGVASAEDVVVAAGIAAVVVSFYAQVLAVAAVAAENYPRPDQ
ncbi:hypothetical protein [Sporomusa sp. KB1]|uniref:hypothetical protein n=1 Tax=Sporomusa sp. KB1 TaxID=943346 RepID=UPI001C96561F|nr:hypothetical protein [Sporomusa sp. KB1]